MRVLILIRSSRLLKCLWGSKMLLRWIEEGVGINLVSSDIPDLDGNFLETVAVPTCINSRFLA